MAKLDLVRDWNILLHADPDLARQIQEEVERLYLLLQGRNLVTHNGELSALQGLMAQEPAQVLGVEHRRRVDLVAWAVEMMYHFIMNKEKS